MPFFTLFLPELTYCLLAATATPLIFRLSEKFTIEGKSFFKTVVLHTFFSIIFFLVWILLPPIINQPLLGRTLEWRSMLNGLILNADRGMMVYWVTLFLHHAYQYHKKYIDSLLKETKLEAQLAQAQLSSLKMQLQPHFLFNTLNSISTLVLKDSKAAHKMIARLGDLLRMSIREFNSQEISLQKELEFVECYLDIEKTRFKDKLTVIFDIEPSSRHLVVPSFLLQPIVENAIKHAISLRSQSGSIKISTKKLEDFLRIEVKDDGPGLPQHLIQKNNSTGIGLKNTRERLFQLYNRNFQLNLSNSLEGGVVVVVEIPIKIDKSDDLPVYKFV